MRARLLTTVLLWGAIAATLFWGRLLGGEILLLLVAAGALWEFAELLKKTGIAVNPPLLCLSLMLGMVGHFWGKLFASTALTSIFTSLALILVLLTHTRRKDFRILPAALGAILIVALGMGCLWSIAILELPQSLIWVFWVMAVIKLSDAGAYLFGRHFGKNKLVPLISPKKTVEGLGGALFAGLLFGALGTPLFATPWLGTVLGFALAAFGCLGDLLESALKRAAGVKDSGGTLPGIGGLLDLCDSVIVAAPVAWLAIKFLG